MSLAHSPKIVTDGLVLYYDMANKKSFPGKPTTNLLAANGGDTAMERASAVYGYYPVDITAQVQAQWSASNNVMTYSFEGKRDRMDGGYPCGYVYFSDWSWSFAGGPSSLFWTAHQSSGTMPDPTGKTVYFNIYHMSAGFPGLSYSRNHQLEWGAYATGYTPGTRSNTGAVVDLTGKLIITATSLTYASDNTFSFNGSADRIVSATTIVDRGVNQEITVSCWMKPSRLAGQHQIICENRSNDASTYNWILYQHITDGAIGFHGIAQNKSAYIPTVGVWINVTNTVTTSGVSTLYINGVFHSVVNGYTYGNGTPGNLCIGANGSGSEFYQGLISNCEIYNRALTEAEVKQNFNALRGRYGV